MQLRQEELNQQEELLAKERQANQELDSSQRRREDIKQKIIEYKEQYVKLQDLNKLLQEDMMDLNKLEEQMAKTLELEGIPQKDFIEEILYGKREQFDFENN